MQLIKIIDHTILKPDCSNDDISKLCNEALENGFGAVCVSPYYVSLAKKNLKNSDVKVATVIGFSMGYSCSASKVEEIKRAIDEGADELDVVINVSAIKNKDWSYVRNDMDSVTTACHMRGKVVKIIFETALLDDEEIIKLCEMAKSIGVDFVKTSTGYNGGATTHAVALMRANLPKKVKIKASGGIRSYEDAIKMIEAGADRLGCSSSVKIAESAKALINK